MTIAAQVIAGEVNEHHVFGILLRIVAQKRCTLAVGFSITCTLRRARDGVDIGFLPLNPAMCLW